MRKITRLLIDGANWKILFICFSNGLIIIEVLNYEIGCQYKSLSKQFYAEQTNSDGSFWANATKYASLKKDDESFVSEIAYMMVTLHRTGA